MTSAYDDPGAPSSVRLVVTTLLMNVLLCGAGFTVYALSGSRLVLAQSADSLNDLVAGAVVAWSARVGSRPRDADHPFGHQRAEPIGALVLAVLTGVLAFAVLQSSAVALFEGRHSTLSGLVAVVLAAKFAVKLVWWRLLARRRATLRSSALDATIVDTRNDTLTCATSVVGFFLSRAGWLPADAVLAIPVALYVGWSGFSLARENIDYLMGAAPPEEVLRELERRAQAVEGVVAVRDLRAQYQGRSLSARIEIVVSGDKSVRDGHDIGVSVQHALEAHELVGEAFVHIDPPGGRPHEPQA